MAANISRAR